MDRLSNLIHPISLLDQRELYFTGALAMVAIAVLVAVGVFMVFAVVNLNARRRGERRSDNLGALQWGIVGTIAFVPAALLFKDADAAWVATGLHQGIGSALLSALFFFVVLGAATVGAWFAVKAATKRPQRAKHYAIAWLTVVGFTAAISFIYETRSVLRDKTPWAGGDTDTLRYNIGGYVADDFDVADSVVLTSGKPFKLCFVNYLATPERTSDTLDADSVGESNYRYAAPPIIPGLARVFYSTLPQSVKCDAWRNGKVYEGFGTYELGAYRPIGRFMRRYTRRSSGGLDWEPVPYSFWHGDTVRVRSAQPFDYALGTKEGHSDGEEVTLWRHERDTDHSLQIRPTPGAIAQPIYLSGVRSAMYGYHLLLALLGYGIGWFLLGKLTISIATTPLFTERRGDGGRDSPEPEAESDMRDIQTEIVQVEERVTSLAARIDGALAPTSAWQHYKNLKHTRRAQENLTELTKVLKGMEAVIGTAVSVARSQNDLKRVEIERRKLEEIETLKHELEAARLHADIAEQKARQRSLENPPKAPAQQRRKGEQPSQATREREAERQEREIEKWREELRGKGLSEQDINAEIERRRRARGWLQ